MSGFDFQPKERDVTTQDAGFPAFRYRPSHGKKAAIVNEETGRICNNTFVSYNSPDYWKLHQEYYTEHGMPMPGETVIGGNRSDPTNARDRSAGLTSKEFQLQKCDEAARRRGNIRCGVKGTVHNKTICSTDVPRWFKSPMAHNYDYYDAQSLVDDPELKDGSSMASSKFMTAQEQKARVKTYRDAKMNEHTGLCMNPQLVSPGSPEFFKSAEQDNFDYFKDSGLAHKVDRGSAESDVFWEYPIGKSMAVVQFPQTNAEARKHANSHIVSERSPRWMKSPYLNNKEFFESKTNQKLMEADRPIEMERKQKRNHIIDNDTGEYTFRKNVVSKDLVPEWMLPTKNASSRPAIKPSATAPNLKPRGPVHKTMPNHINHSSTVVKKRSPGGQTSPRSPRDEGHFRSPRDEGRSQTARTTKVNCPINGFAERVRYESSNGLCWQPSSARGSQTERASARGSQTGRSARGSETERSRR